MLHHLLTIKMTEYFRRGQSDTLLQTWQTVVWTTHEWDEGEWEELIQATVLMCRVFLDSYVSLFEGSGRMKIIWQGL